MGAIGITEKAEQLDQELVANSLRRKLLMRRTIKCGFCVSGDSDVSANHTFAG
jgi:hypothetical protein